MGSKKIDEVADVKTGGNAPQGKEYFENGTYPFVRVQHFSGDTEYVERWDLINKKAVDKYKLKLFSEGAIVFPKSGASIRLEKRAKLPSAMYVVSHLCVLIPKNISTDFLFYYLKNIRLGVASGGSTLPFLNISAIGRKLIPLPSLPEQQNIAHILSKIQSAIETQEKIIKTTTELKKALMQKLFTEGLHGEKQKETEIGRMPKSWSLVSFGEIADFKNGINFNASQKGNKGIPTIDVLNMYGRSITVDISNLYRVNINLHEDSENILKDGDMLFVRSSLKPEGVGWVSLYKEHAEPTSFCGFIIRARLLKNDFIPLFLVYYFRSDSIRKKFMSMTRVSITNVNQGYLKSFVLPLPSLEEQREIVRTLQMIEEKTEMALHKKQILQSLFRSMLHHLMTGQIRVKCLKIA